MLGRLLTAFSPARLQLDLSFEEEPVSPVTPISQSSVPRELQRFGESFGVDLRKSREFIPVFSYVLFERPLPQGWKAYRTEDGREYYHNKFSGESAWTSPAEAVLRVFVAAARDGDFFEALRAAVWSQAERRAAELGNWVGPVASEGGEYFYNRTTRTSSWLHPATDAVWEATQFLNFARLLMSDVVSVDAQLAAEISTISDQLVSVVSLREPLSEFKEKISARKARVDAEGVVYVKDVSLESSPGRPSSSRVSSMAGSLAPSAFTFLSMQDQFNRSMEIASQISGPTTPIHAEADQPPVPSPRLALSVPPLPEAPPPRRRLDFGMSDVVLLESVYLPALTAAQASEAAALAEAVDSSSVGTVQDEVSETADLPAIVVAKVLADISDLTETLTSGGSASGERESSRQSSQGYHPFRNPETFSDVEIPMERATEPAVAATPFDAGNFDSPMRSHMRPARGDFSSPSRVGNILPNTSTGCVFFSMAAPRERSLYDESPSRSSPRFGGNYRNFSN